jgi:hypothetical protein
MILPLLGLYPEERKSTYNRDICILISYAALFTKTKLNAHHLMNA